MKKQTKKHWSDYWKGKSRLTIITYAVVRLIVVAVLIRSLFTGQAESVFTCVLTLFLLFLPSIVSRKMHMQLPTGLEVTIVIFIFAAEILGLFGVGTEYDIRVDRQKSLGAHLIGVQRDILCCGIHQFEPLGFKCGIANAH